MQCKYYSLLQFYMCMFFLVKFDKKVRNWSKCREVHWWKYHEKPFLGSWEGLKSEKLVQILNCLPTKMSLKSQFYKIYPLKGQLAGQFSLVRGRVQPLFVKPYNIYNRKYWILLPEGENLWEIFISRGQISSRFAETKQNFH